MSDLKLPALNPETVPVQTGSDYPGPFAVDPGDRTKRKVGDALGLTIFGVNLVTLPPGCWSSQRHWHSRQDEFVYMISGEMTLVTDGGEQVLTAGMMAGFPAGSGDGHHAINKSDADAVYLEVGDRTEDDECDYPDIDMLTRWIDDEERFVHKDGTPYDAPPLAVKGQP
jgi:uncharacterized cupin superfamily protein